MQEQINCNTQVSATHDITGLLMQQQINCNTRVYLLPMILQA